MISADHVANADLDAIGREAAALFLGGETDLEFIQASESFVFRALHEGRQLILRVTPFEHRSREQILTELRFTSHLRAHGFPTPAHRVSLEGAEVATCSHGNVCMFEHADGAKVEAFGSHWNRELFDAWGTSLARIHVASASFPRTKERPVWYEDRCSSNLAEVLSDEPEALRLYMTAFPELQDSLGRGEGLIHGDPGLVNFNRTETGQLVFFDFDDCLYHAWLADVAMALWPLRRQPPQDRSNYLNWMLEGYSTVRTPDVCELERLELLFKWRSVTLFAYFLRSWAPPTAEQETWLARMREYLAGPCDFLSD